MFGDVLGPGARLQLLLIAGRIPPAVIQAVQTAIQSEGSGLAQDAQARPMCFAAEVV